MLVEEIMTPKDKLVIVDQLAPVREALELMKKFQIKSVVVDKNGPYGAYGLVTFKNVLQAIVAQEGDIDLLNVYDIATIPAISVTRKVEMKYVAKMMVRHSIKRVLVIDNNELHGIITMTDIIGVLLDEI
ncbi:CBS domain-containing protein [Nitrosophilus labii]|uniref:CBS domain-containing protein n=1 Tax=Nitrosophilus labii TaxID=2706014 RepID=UPI001656DEE6|nr:CBS domain-containing protein [Nitrosophilus labii]